MKILNCLVILFFAYPAIATQPSCVNIGFELGNFTNWTGYTWIYNTRYIPYITPKLAGILPGRQTIMSDTTAYDIKTGGKLRKVPSGYKYSARLGDAIVGALFESLSYTFKVDTTNAMLIWKFAVVLQDPLGNHLKDEEPRFGVELRDEKGNSIPGCANYDVRLSDAKITGFNKNSNDTLPIYWRDWTTVGANLVPYMGQTVTIEFMAGDCSREGHYGYAYFVAGVQPMTINVKYCTSDSIATLSAPEGFNKFIWKNNKGVNLGTERIIKVEKPVEGEIFYCSMTSATGCIVDLEAKVIKYEEPKVDYTSSMIDCVSNKGKFINLSTASEGTMTYKWDFGDGNTSNEENPTYTFRTSGMHQVSLEVFNSAHFCSSKMSKSVESFSPPLVGLTYDSVYCKGDPTLLKAYGAHHYLWSNGSDNPVYSVLNPGVKIWLLGYSSTGCVSDTIFHTVYETPDWNLNIDGKTLYCFGQSTELKASGAVAYKWNTDETTNSIIVKSPGTYKVNGTNEHNCQKSSSISIIEDPLPLVNFIISDTTVDTRHNRLSCSIPEQLGVTYYWDMGDGSYKSGASINHTYSVSYSIPEYTIKLTATNANGCIQSASKSVDVVLFVSNVFTPNGDGVNDKFMVGVDLKVFDRNGALIYKGTDGWDGRFNGKLAESDTYFYLINYTERNKPPLVRKGFVTLIK